MTDSDKVKNIISFLFILFGENDTLVKEIIRIEPKYFIEKFERYIESKKSESEWGLHTNLINLVFKNYCDKWGLK